MDDKEGEEEGEQGWRLSQAWTVDLLVGASFVLQNRLKIDICHLLAWIVQSDPLSQGHQCSQKFGLSLVLKIFDERYFLDVDHSLGLEGI